MLSDLTTYLRARIGVATSEEGATAVEYGIMVALIAIVIIIAVAFLGDALEGVFDRVGQTLAEHT